MKTEVAKESLEMCIKYLSGRPLSLKEEYQLLAYKILLAILEAEDDKRG